jgi:hypothetical protein
LAIEVGSVPSPLLPPPAIVTAREPLGVLEIRVFLAVTARPLVRDLEL